MILVSNCPHDNGIYTIVDAAQGTVMKSSYSPDGMSRLTRELAGYTWFRERAGLPSDSKLRLFQNKRGSYARLRVTYFTGERYSSVLGLGANRQSLLAAINLYTDLWPRVPGRLSPMHGDFSLGNMIEHDGALLLIDWEHFKEEGAPWGFDLVNMLYECVFFSFKKRDQLSRRDIDTFADVRGMVRELFEDEEKFSCSLSALTNFINQNHEIWNDLSNKLPVMKFSADQTRVVRRLEEHGE